jgi:hypothetical protein
MAGMNPNNFQAMPEEQKGMMLAMLEQVQVRDRWRPSSHYSPSPIVNIPGN